MHSIRSVLLCLASLLTLVVASPARSQWTPAGPYTFVRGQTYDLFFAQPAVEDFLAADIFVRYSPLVFDPVSLLPGTPSGLSSLLSVMASPPTPYSGGQEEVYVAVNPSASAIPGDFGLNLPAGSWFGVRFNVRADAPLGATDPVAAFDLIIGDRADLDPLFEELTFSGNALIPTTIVAVPEPGTWMMMLAGLSLIGFAAARARRQT